MENLPYVIVRTYSAGVFAGYLEKRDGKEVTLVKARRLWYWDGASSLSQLAMEGVKKPENCKFPCEVDRVVLLEAIEILDVTEEARINIAKVPVETVTSNETISHSHCSGYGSSHGYWSDDGYGNCLGNICK